jgi:hypothetical protein
MVKFFFDSGKNLLYNSCLIGVHLVSPSRLEGYSVDETENWFMVRSKVRIKGLARASIIIFFIGFIGGMTILAISVFGDYEALMFKSALDGKTALKTLDCPIMMATSGTNTISLTLSNPTNSRISPSVWANFSQGYLTLIREERENLFLEPDESTQLEWTVSGEDAAFEGRWVLAKVKVYSQYPLPSSLGSCGIFVADMFGFTGDQVLIFSISMSVLLMGLGFGLWIRATKPVKGPETNQWTRTFIILGGLVFLGLTTNFIGSHLMILSGIIFVISLVAVISFVLWQGDPG